MTVSKNITYEYAMTSQSDLKEIGLALKELRETIDPDGEYAPEVPGYSVSLDILSTLKDIVAAKIGDSAELNKEYANDMAGIADMIRQLDGNYPAASGATVSIFEDDVTLTGSARNYTAEVSDVDLTVSAGDIALITTQYGSYKGYVIEGTPGYFSMDYTILDDNDDVEYEGKMVYKVSDGTLSIKLGGSSDASDHSGEQHIRIKVVHCDEF